MTDTKPTPILPADDCQTMAEVRAGVDAVDGALVALLADRFAYMRAAARIKPTRAVVRDALRKAEVLANITEHASALDLPGERLVEVWDTLVEQSIAYEFDIWDQTRR